MVSKPESNQNWQKSGARIKKSQLKLELALIVEKYTVGSTCILRLAERKRRVSRSFFASSVVNSMFDVLEVLKFASLVTLNFFFSKFCARQSLSNP